MADIIEASVLTTNIVNFVSLCERLIRINLIDFLNSHYFNIVHRYILKYMGMLDITVGDRQLAYWILSRNKEETYMACKAALDIINEIYEYNKNLSIDEHFEVCISITTGKVIKAQKTIMGDYVNFGARLASDCFNYYSSIFCFKLIEEGDCFIGCILVRRAE